MDTIFRQLRAKQIEHPESQSIRETLSHLADLHATLQTGSLPSRSIEAVRHDFQVLEEEGVWEKTPEHERQLQELCDFIARTRKTDDQSRPIAPHKLHQSRPSIAVPPPLSAPLLPVSSIGPAILPVELVEVLNHTYFLHILAMEPEKVLPPGKSLLSVMTHPSTHTNDTDSLKARVEGAIHKAFWDEALETLSNPIPSVEMPRLQRLYQDLHTALTPLLPQGHPVLVTLSSPLSPTSSPLQSAIGHLREILVALKERCAPSRDKYIEALIARLDEPTQNLATVVVETVRDILKIAEIMKEDLSQFVLGAMGERQLRVVLASQAKEQERQLIFSLWTRAIVWKRWSEWVNEVDHTSVALANPPMPHQRWIVRLMQALAVNTPVSCTLPTKSIQINTDSSTATLDSPREVDLRPNALPPSFFFVTPKLLLVQNYIQALVIVASLRSLIRMTPPNIASGDTTGSREPNAAEDFARRVWVLLKDEIEGAPDADSTKIVNLADEVIRVYQSQGNRLSEDEEKKLRAAVDRTLQPTDPVFILLQKRVIHALTEQLLSPEQQSKPIAPQHLQAGRDARETHTRPHIQLGLPTEHTFSMFRSDSRPKVSIKGFDGESLKSALADVSTILGMCVEWTKFVWDDLLRDQ
ncbi:hypothetical protein K474DRAFT_1672050 [Panus rudis PR-1116 ss-1]|nr:hypothetical protein K474DRAFT_1672050 [Panus rudis PR-1116 ss-1]